MEFHGVLEEKMNFKYENCFVAFLDILGFRSKILDSRNNDETLKILIESLNTCGAFPSRGEKISESRNSRRIFVQGRFFSDTILFFLKVKPHDLTQLFIIIRYLQDRLWEKKICLRGAVTLGEMYWPSKGKSISLGPALIEAYDLETKVAIYPRILISQKLYKYIIDYDLHAVPFAQSGQLIDFIRRDFDGIYFLDLLNTKVTRTVDEEFNNSNSVFTIQWTAEAENSYTNILNKIDALINENIECKNEKISQKYKWLKSYKDTSDGQNE